LTNSNDDLTKAALSCIRELTIAVPGTNPDVIFSIPLDEVSYQVKTAIITIVTSLVETGSPEILVSLLSNQSFFEWLRNVVDCQSAILPSMFHALIEFSVNNATQELLCRDLVESGVIDVLKEAADDENCSLSNEYAGVLDHLFSEQHFS
jgi:hypothetical protein